MKKALGILACLTSINSFATDSSCIDRTSLTGLSNDAELVIIVDSIRPGQSLDMDDDIEIKVTTEIQGYDMVASVVENGIEHTIKSSGHSRSLDTSTLDDIKIENVLARNAVNKRVKISFKDIHNELSRVSNPRHANINVIFDEHDYGTLNDSIANTEIAIQDIRKLVLNHGTGYANGLIAQSNEAIVTAQYGVTCNK